MTSLAELVAAKTGIVYEFDEDGKAYTAFDSIIINLELWRVTWRWKEHDVAYLNLTNSGDQITLSGFVGAMQVSKV